MWTRRCGTVSSPPVARVSLEIAGVCCWHVSVLLLVDVWLICATILNLQTVLKETSETIQRAAQENELKLKTKEDEKKRFERKIQEASGTALFFFRVPSV